LIHRRVRLLCEDVSLGLISRDGVCDASLGAMAIRLVGVAISKELVYRTLRISDRINHERRNEGKRGRKATDLVWLPNLL
jgi:hypothetical protein